MKYFWAALILAVLMIGFYRNEDKSVPTVLKFGETVLNIEIADTDAERVQGLSGRESLPPNSGLLFVFEKEGIQQFWMKDMKFPIDIAWLDKNKKIVLIESNVLPETYPKTFGSSVSALYVLETPANFFTSHNIPLDTQAEF